MRWGEFLGGAKAERKVRPLVATFVNIVAKKL
jgi:hypothetical protein